MDKRKSGIFYGWYIVGVGFLAQFAGMAMSSSALAVFFKSMEKDLHWTRLEMSTTRSLEMLTTGMMAPLLGGYLDRYGARWPMAIGGLCFGAGLILLGQVQEVWQVLIIRVCLLTGATVGMGGLAVNVAISNWFIRRRGQAMSISGSGSAAARVLIAPVLTATIAAWGWRNSWVFLGAIVWLLVVVPAFLVVRRRPEDMGLLPDGATEPASLTRPTSKATDLGRTWTRRQALCTAGFWSLVFTFGVTRIGEAAFYLHSFPYLTDIGATETVAALTMSLGSAVQLIAILVWGHFADRFEPRYIGSAQFVVQTVGILLFMVESNPTLAIVGYTIFCFGSGGEVVVTVLMWASFFGRRSLGVVRSAAMPISVLFSASGPILFGWAYSYFGGYGYSFAGYTVTLVVAAVLILYCRKPNDQPAVTT
jgi:MFS family permease